MKVINMEFKTYKSKESVEAVEYQEGMEDGFNVRYADKEDYEMWERVR